MNRCHPDPFDLRPAFAAALGLLAAAPADDEDTGPSPAADDGPVVPAGDAAGEGDDDEDTTDDDADNPRIKELSDEAGKWRRKLRQAEKRIAELEDGQASDLQDENRTLRLRLAWERATAGKLKDIDAAWKLAEDALKAVEVKDGEVDIERLGEIVAHVIDRYPYLVEADKPANDTPSSPWPDGGADTGKPPKKKPGQGTDRATLAKKYPALRGRV